MHVLDYVIKENDETKNEKKEFFNYFYDEIQNIKDHQDNEDS